MEYQITYEHGAKYGHLRKAHCSCGWSHAGYAIPLVVEHWASEHLRDDHPHSSGTMMQEHEAEALSWWRSQQ